MELLRWSAGIADHQLKLAGRKRLGFKRANSDRLVLPGTTTGGSAAALPAPFRG
jgi:hypothetical protein